MHALALHHLLQLAATHSVQFKEATGALREDERKLLEESIRATVRGASSGSAGGGGTGGSNEVPKIELKLF